MDIIYLYLQSGSLYTDWGWFNSENKLFEIRESIKNQHNCSKDESVYKCLENKSVDELLSTVVTDNPLVNHWHPVPDDDFFPDYAPQEVYNATKRQVYSIIVFFYNNKKERTRC